ncbi:MAG: hypothetical protein JWL71_3041 [Acidobacteria bacterium]|nr:hypothetical protein [Acidobacteriota bacterium]
MSEGSVASGVAQALAPATRAWLLTLVFAAGAAAQSQQPIIAPAAAAPEFLTRYDFHMSIARLLPSAPAPPLVIDDRFAWDAHFGGSFDIADLVVGRLGVIVDYQAVMGSEYRPFDPNQGNYTLEGFASARLDANTEVAGIFHHVSRHLSDRPKAFAVAYNEIGGRLMRRLTAGTTTVDVDLEGGRAVQHSYVDYTWIGEGQLLIRHPINEHIGVFAHGHGQAFAVDEALARRGAQAGGQVEAGVRITGRSGVLEIFGGYEKRVDADPLDRLSQRWGLLGFRLLSR